MPDDNDLKYRLPVKSTLTVEVLAEFELKARAHLAQSVPPRTLERAVEEFIRNLAEGQTHRQVIFGWPPQTEKRAGSAGSKLKTGEN